MHFHAGAHQERVEHVILKDAIDSEDQNQPEHVRIAADRSHQENQRGSRERADYGNHLQRGGDSRQQDGVRNAQRRKKGHMGNEGRDSQQ